MTQRDLVWNALRMRPDRIVVGEVRGPEAFDMLQAMNTGHDGSISTVHANSARDALTRVENMVQMGQVSLPSRAIRSQIVAALDIIVQVERMRDGQRRVLQITEVIGLEGEVITTNDIALFEYQQEDVHGRISGAYRSTQAIPKFNESSRLLRAGSGLGRGHAATPMKTLFIVVGLMLLMGAAATLLLLDVRQRRIERQVAIALSTSHEETIPSIRRSQVGSRWCFFIAWSTTRSDFPTT